MKFLGWTLVAGMMLMATGESKAQLMIGNPLTGQGVFIGGGGVSVNSGIGYSSFGYNPYAYGYNPYNGYGMAGYGNYGLSSNRMYSSGYVAPGNVGGFGLGGYQSYSSSFLTPYYGGYSSFGYNYPRYYRRGMYGRRYGW